MVVKGLGLIVSLIGVFWLAIAGGYAVYRYDRAPAGWPNYPVKVLFFHATLHLPGAGALTIAQAQLARGRAAAEAMAARSLRVETASASANAEVNASEGAAEGHAGAVTRILKEKVHDYVTVEADRHCVVPDGFVRLHDAQLAGDGGSLSGLPGAAGLLLNAPSGVALSEVSAADGDNFGALNACRARVAGWDNWYSRQRAAFAQH